jgi:hypothetical protein
MRCLPVCPLLLLAMTAAATAADPPCTNGSFEELDRNGFPVDWSPVGDGVEVTADAHQGARALRLRRTRDTASSETGLNRGWRPGQGTAMIDQLSGGIDFHYQAIAADGAKLMIYVIPMNGQSVEHTASRRAEFTVPDDHIGDGKWHHARLKYDFTREPAVKWVHFAARIVGTAGELLLDDFSYVERTGPILQFGKVRLEEDPTAPGERCTLRVPLWSRGDEPAHDIQITSSLPAGLTAKQATFQLPQLPADQRALVRIDIAGRRQEPGEIGLAAKAGAFEAETRILLRPELEIVNVGPTTPLVSVGGPVTVQCVLKNSGNAWLSSTNLKFSFSSEIVEKTVALLAPGNSQTVSAEFVPTEQSVAQPVMVEVRCGEAAEPYVELATVVVGAAAELPAPRDALHSEANDRWAVLENERVRYVFRHHQFGWGPGDLYVRKDDAWILVAQIPQLSRLVTIDAQDNRLERKIVTTESPIAELNAGEGRLVFHWTATGTDGGRWDVRVCLSLAEHSKVLQATHELQCTQAGRLLAFDSLVLHALARDEAVYPGLEWLVDDEVSSSTLDIAEGHADQIRYVVHPNMITIPAIGIHAQWGTLGLLWDIQQKWDGEHDRPSVMFASPDRFDNHCTHVAGLFLPGTPTWVRPNQREAETPYPLNPGQRLRLDCRILADVEATDALAPVDAWIDEHGLPEPAPLPHGTYAGEIEFSMQGYLASLWIPESREWWTSKGGGILSDKGRPSAYIADLLIGELLAPTESVRQACRERAAEVLSLVGGTGRIDWQRFGSRVDIAFANPGLIAGLLQSRDENGMWAFDADRIGQGPFEGVDYRDLGPHQAIELGTTAINAYQVLRYARIAGDRKAYTLMLPTLERMARFRVPRAAQVWEVPVHTPDVLAASNAMDAFLEAYRFSGDRRWLAEAVRQARHGLPFIYLWDDPQQPFLVGASIPVLGATWYQGSWFGRPVQWNGLCYANSLLRLAEYDDSRDWRKLAETIIRSAIQQQDQTGNNTALWPDNLSAMNGEKCAWVFAPRQIVQNVLKLIGRDEDPATLIVNHGADRLHITSTARLASAQWDGHSLAFVAAFPDGEQGCVLVANVARPSSVAIDGVAVAEREDAETAADPGWRYDTTNAFLTIRVTRSGEVTINVDDADFRAVERLPETVREIMFEFDDATDGWVEVHDVLELRRLDGMVRGKITGPDPYILRTMLAVPADSCKTIELRIRLTAGSGGQLFWTTKDSPSFDESKSVYLPLAADGEFHTLKVDLSSHPGWTGEITGLRIDPGGGAAAGEFSIDYIRGRNM